MAYARAGKHYRVAQKTAETSSVCGIYLTRQRKIKWTVMVIVFLVLVFVKGIILGFWAGRNDE